MHHALQRSVTEERTHLGKVKTDGIPQISFHVDSFVVASAVPVAVEVARVGNVVWLGRDTQATSSNGAEGATQF